MGDLTDRTDIELLVNEFYQKVKQDTTIGYIFTDVANLDWDKHLPKMYDFWESILFGKGAYKGNPMVKHIDLSKSEALKDFHFEKWKALWKLTLEENFEGPKANEALSRATSIAGLMLFKVSNVK